MKFFYYYFLLIFVFLSTTNPLFAQIFTKVTSGPIVSSGGSSYGSSWIDLDLDGDLDLFVSNFSGQSNFLYENLGNGTFNQLTNHPLTQIQSYSLGNSWIDYDNDCDLDFFVVDGGESAIEANQLFENDNGNFTLITSGVIANDFGFSQSSNWADYDNDGLIDLFVANVIGQSNFMYHNEGGGNFTALNNIITSYQQESNYANWIDYNNDGWMDLFVVNRFGTDNQLFRNDGTGNFIEITTGNIVNDGGNCYGSSWGDYDNDGDFDLFVANNGDQNNFLYRNNGDESFTKITTGIVVNNGGRTYGSEWADIDNDGDLDLFITNRQGQNNRLYINDGNSGFNLASSEIVSNEGGDSRGCSFVDYDNDGDLDLFVTNRNNENNFLYLNNGNANQWAKIKCIGTISNRAAIGTKIRLKTTINGNPTWQLRHIASEYGYATQSNLEVHFGLGNANNIDSIIIEYPSGVVCTYTNISPNQWLVFHESDCLENLIIENHTICEGEIAALSVSSPTTAWQTDSIGNVFFIGQEVEIGPLFSDTIIYATTLDACSQDAKFKFIIEVLESDTSYVSFNLCLGDTLFLSGMTITESGDYPLNFMGSNGCDSVEINLVEVETNIFLFEEIDLCAGDSALVFGNIVNTPGVFTQGFPSTTFCDTIVEITVNVFSEISIEISGIFCVETQTGTASVQVFNGSPPFQYNWSNSEDNSEIITVNSPGNYSLTVTDINSCSVQQSFTIEENIPLALSLDLLGVSYCGAEDGQVDIQEIPGSNLQYSLNGIDFQTTLTFDELLAGAYILYVLDETGCLHIQEFLIETPPLTEIGIPNVFTPNGDGDNDFFNVFSNGTIEIIEFKVYSRWGQMVYDNETPNQGWDGTFKGENAPSDVYIYTITIDLLCGEVRNEKGDLTLLR